MRRLRYASLRMRRHGTKRKAFHVSSRRTRASPPLTPDFDTTDATSPVSHRLGPPPLSTDLGKKRDQRILLDKGEHVFDYTFLRTLVRLPLPLRVTVP